MHKPHFAALAAIAMTALTVGAAIESADARVRRGQGSITTQRGTYQGVTEVRRERGSRTRDTTVTGPNGGQRTTHDERTRNRQEGTYSRDHTTTYNDGSTREVNLDRQRTGEGEYSTTREVTGRDGETRTQTGDFSVERTENGRSISGDIAMTNHGQIDYSREVSRQDGVRSINSSATFGDGTAITRASTAACGDGACASSGAVTGRDGGVTTWEQSRVRTQNGATLSRDTTFADGTSRSIDRAREGNGDGAGVVTRTVTDRDGDTRTQTGEYNIDRTP